MASKRYSKKQVNAVLTSYYGKANYLMHNRQELNDKLDLLDSYILKNGTKFDKLSGIGNLTTYVRDEINGYYNDSSSDMLSETVSALILILRNIGIYINDSEAIFNAPILPNDVLIRYIKTNYKDELKKHSEWNQWERDGKYPIVPVDIIDKQEEKSIEALTKRYEKITSPSTLGKATKKIKDVVPDKVLNALEEAGHGISEAELYKKIMEIVTDGFDTLLKYSSKVTISEDTIIKQINKTLDDNHIFNLEEVCYARGYDIAKLVAKFKTQNIYVALAEGGVTGAIGLPGMALNIATSTFIFYRAIQSIAMYYGYDVKNNSDELELATEVFMQAMDPQRESSSEIGGAIAKFMAMSEALLVKNTVSNGWKAMAERGGICLLITQIRALANKAAEKALYAAGKKGLENKLFDGALEAIGKKLSQKAVIKGATPAAAIITALMDVSTMKNVIEYADIFYNKRFLVEKQTRIGLLNEEKIIDVDYEVEE